MKNDDVLVVKLPKELKKQLMDKCEAGDISASKKVRRLIKDWVENGK